MDNDAIKFLAAKLGTTVEYLWGVLIRQAPISGATNLLVVIAITFAFIWWVRFFSKKVKVPPETESNRYPRAEWQDAEPGYILTVMLALFVIILIGCELPDIVAAFFNPEYWALKQVLGK